MTAEVVIGNGYAIAMAADSAVTVGGRKIYNSAVKLFSFSKVHPVGIMIYGSASLLDVPWETIIKTARHELKDQKFDTLEAYGEFFIEFIKQSTSFYSVSSQEAWLRSKIEPCMMALSEQLRERVKNEFAQGIKVDDEMTIGFLSEIVNGIHSGLKGLNHWGEYNASIEKRILTYRKSFFKKVIDGAFQSVPMPKSILTKLYQLSSFLITRDYPTPNASGIVIAGFGDKEIYPSLVTYEIDGYLDEGLKYKKLNQKCKKISSGNDCVIVPFAQEDMVYAFMEGVNPSVQSLFNTSLARVFERLPDLLDDADLVGSAKPVDVIKEEFKQKTTELLIDFKKSIHEHVYAHHVSPVVGMVAALPKDELAAMAESLVNLTAFKRRMTENLETVGGPIDVAVISKGDGLVWVKRKLYFPKELNDHFFQNYYRGI